NGRAAGGRERRPAPAAPGLFPGQGSPRPVLMAVGPPRTSPGRAPRPLPVTPKGVRTMMTPPSARRLAPGLVALALLAAAAPGSPQAPDPPYRVQIDQG